MDLALISTGKKPSGLCAAALVIASHCHNTPVKTKNVCRCALVTFDTVKKHLDKFKSSPYSALSV